MRLNEIGVVQVEAQRPLFIDPYRRNRYTGSFILLDPLTNDTLGAGMIEAAVEETVEAIPHTASVSLAGQPEALWRLARRVAEAGHPIAVLPGEVLLIGPAGTSSTPTAPTVELSFTPADSVDGIFQELLRRGVVAQK